MIHTHTHTHITARSASQNYLSKKEQMKTDYWHSSTVFSNQWQTNTELWTLLQERMKALLIFLKSNFLWIVLFSDSNTRL